MKLSILNRRPKATSRANAIALSGELQIAAARNLRLSAELIRSRTALSDVVASVDGVKAPNGTLRMVRRIASEGLGG